MGMFLVGFGLACNIAGWIALSSRAHPLVSPVLFIAAITASLGSLAF